MRLIDLEGMRSVLRRRPVEFVVAVVTAAIVVLVGVEEGIVAAIVLSVMTHLRHSYRPHDELLAAGPRPGTLRGRGLATGAQAEPGLALYAFGSNLYYANADRLQQEVLGLADRADPPLRWVCLVGTAVGDVDFSASETLRAVHGALADRGITLVVAGLPDAVRAELDRDGLIALIGGDHMFEGVDEVLDAYRALEPASA